MKCSFCSRLAEDRDLALRLGWIWFTGRLTTTVVACVDCQTGCKEKISNLKIQADVKDNL
jgi:hypothetical protein